MDIQALMNAFSASAKATRSGYHLTLGKLIEALEVSPPDAAVEFDCGGSPSTPHSYRGYYEDLAFEADREPTTTRELLRVCRTVHGETLEGWKGGDYLMDDNAILWTAEVGHSGGRAITGMRWDGDKLVLVTAEIND